jgi:hypothetical protein
MLDCKSAAGTWLVRAPRSFECHRDPEIVGRQGESLVTRRLGRPPVRMHELPPHDIHPPPSMLQVKNAYKAAFTLPADGLSPDPPVSKGMQCRMMILSSPTRISLTRSRRTR